MARDYRAEYAARQARAQSQGYGSYREQRTARAAGRPLPTDPIAGTYREPVGGGPARGGVDIVGSGAPAAIIAEIERAAARGQSVAIQATFQRTPGDPNSTRTRRITQLPVGGADAAPGGAGRSGLGAPVTTGSGGAGGTGAAPVQVIVGPPGSGIPATQLLQWIDEYDLEDDPWAWLADLWDDVY